MHVYAPRGRSSWRVSWRCRFPCCRFARRPRRPRQTFNPQDVIPVESIVREGTLPNGLKFTLKRNTRPAGRVSMRLAIKAGSLYEADDQQGLAHLIEHMAFNGSAHFKPGEVFSYFESVGARLGPHINASTSFDETIYRLDLPTDNPEVVAKGLTALADFAGGLTLDPVQIDKERGVVIEEWRGTAGRRLAHPRQQIPVLYYQSRYAERMPIGKPEIIQNAPAGASARVLRRLVSPRTNGRRSPSATSSRSRWRRQSERPSGRLSRAARAACRRRTISIPLHRELHGQGDVATPRSRSRRSS